MKTKDKIISLLIFIISYFIVVAMINKASAQSKLKIMAGYKSFEFGYSLENEELLNFGLSASIADSKMLEKRANKNDVNRNVHEFKSDIVPAVFGTVGATFDKFTITGKIGGSFVSQNINNQATKDIFFAVGLAMEYQINCCVRIRGSYDNVNSAMAGVAFKI